MKTYLLAIIILYLTLQIKAQTVLDVDGNTYNTVTIGTQIWMKENLKTTKYNDGTPITKVTANASWIAMTTGAYCDNNNLSSNGEKYGHLYNYYTVIDSRKLCPTGWNVPDRDEWLLLESTLGDTVVADKMKTTTNDWRSTTGATNESGFSALPGGYRQDGGYFIQIGIGAFFMSSTENFDMSLHDNSSFRQELISDWTKGTGLSVRCIKDLNTFSKMGYENTDELFIYPNPAKDKFLLMNNNSTYCQILIFDLDGKHIVNREISSDFIDISNLSKGIYIVKIIDSGKIAISKLIKE